MSKNNRRRRRQRLPEEPVEIEITALSSEGRGIAHIDERTVLLIRHLRANESFLNIHNEIKILQKVGRWRF